MSTEAPTQTLHGPAADPAHDQIRKKIDRTRRSVKAAEFWAGLLWFAAGSLLFLLLLSVVDHWIVGLSQAARITALAVYVIAGAGFLYVYVTPLLFHRINPLYAARIIEQGQPALKNSLLNFLFLTRNQQGTHKAVLDAVETQAATDLSKLSIDHLIDYTKAIRVGYFLAGLALILGLYTLISPKNPVQTAMRVAMPWADVARPSRVTIESVEPGDTAVYQGDTIPVAAKVLNLASSDKVEILFSTLDGQVVDQRVPLTDQEGRMYFSGLLSPGESGIQQDLVYRIEAGDAVSPDYYITAREAPAIDITNVRYEFPPYTRLPAQVQESDGHLRALEGTEVTLSATANRPIEKAFVEFDPGTQASQTAEHQIPMRLSEDALTATVRFPLELNSTESGGKHRTYQIRFRTTEGMLNPHPVLYDISVIRDLPPDIEIVEPVSTELEVAVNGRLPFRVRGLDPDFAISQVFMHGESAGESAFDVPLLGEPQTGQVLTSWDFVPQEHNLKPGDVVEIVARAEDNQADFAGTPHPNSAESNPRIVRILEPLETPPQPRQQGDGADSGAAGEEQPPQDDSQQGNAGENQEPSGEPGDAADSPQNQEGGEPSDQEGMEGQSDSSEKQPGEQSGDPQSGSDSQEGNEGQGDPREGSPQEGESGSTQKPQDGQKGEDRAGQPQEGQPQSGEPEQGQSNSSEMQPQSGANGSGSSQETDDQQSQNQEGQPPQGSGSGNASRPPSSTSENQPASGNQAEGAAGKRTGRPGDPNKGGQLEQGDSQTQRNENSQVQRQQGPLDSSGAQDGDAFERIQDYLKEKQQGQQSQKSAKPQSQESGHSNAESSAQNQTTQQPGEPQSSTDQAGEAPSTDQPTGDPMNPETMNPETQPGSQPESGEAEGANSPMGQPQQDDPSRMENAQPGGQSQPGENAQEQAGSKTGQTDNNEGESSQRNTQNDEQGAGQNKGGAVQKDEQGNPSEKSERAGDEGQGDNTDSGAGKMGSEDESGSPESSEATNKQDANKSKPDSQSNQEQGDQPKSPSNSNKQSDSQGENRGDQSGGGGSGGGQSAKQAGNDSAGSTSAADEGAGAAEQQGEGETGEDGGDGPESTGQTGSSGKQPGAGSQQSPSDNGEETGSGQPGENQPRQPPGDMRPPEDQQGAGGASIPQGGGLEGEAAGQPWDGPRLEPGQDQANLEYAKQATDMILDELKHQQQAPDEELLEDLGWSREEFQQFVDRWQKMKSAASSGDQKSQKELNDALRSLGLSRGADQTRSVESRGASSGGSADAQRSSPPASFMEQYRAYLKGASSK